MELSQLTTILLNVLLVVVIIVMYIHLTQLIKHDGVKIKVLQDQVKEGMSAAQRYGLAGRYVGKRANLLLPTDKQDVGDPAKRFPLITNSRGNFDMSDMISKKTTVAKGNAAEVASNIGITVADAIQSGASQASAVTGLKNDHIVETDETQTVQPQQNGLIETTEQFTGTNSRVAPAGNFLYTSEGKPVISGKY